MNDETPCYGRRDARQAGPWREPCRRLRVSDIICLAWACGRATCTTDFIAKGKQLFQPTSFLRLGVGRTALRANRIDEPRRVRADDEPVGAAFLTGLGLRLLAEL